MIRIVLLAAAREELFSGQDFYNARRTGLGDEFVEKVNQTLRLIAEYPYIGAKTKRGARRFVLARFPYTLLYRVHPDRIVVTRLVHDSREFDFQASLPATTLHPSKRPPASPRWRLSRDRFPDESPLSTFAQEKLPDEDRAMKPAVQQITEAFLQLSWDERQEVAEAVIASFLTDAESEATLGEEIARRLEDLESGREKGIPAEEVMRDLRRLVSTDMKPPTEEEKRRTEAFMANENEVFPTDEMILMARTRVLRRAFARGEEVNPGIARSEPRSSEPGGAGRR